VNRLIRTITVVAFTLWLVACDDTPTAPSSEAVVTFRVGVAFRVLLTSAAQHSRREPHRLRARPSLVRLELASKNVTFAASHRGLRWLPSHVGRRNPIRGRLMLPWALSFRSKNGRVDFRLGLRCAIHCPLSASVGSILPRGAQNQWPSARRQWERRRGRRDCGVRHCGFRRSKGPCFRSAAT
jgi:hypothetical protein